MIAAVALEPGDLDPRPATRARTRHGAAQRATSSPPQIVSTTCHFARS